jgi:hypothetical protein
VSLRGWVAALRSHTEIALPDALVEDVVRRHNAQPWFVYAKKFRSSRWHASESSFWIAKHLGVNARILETGCGCALNLIWLGQVGFRNLHGFDIDPAAISAGRELCTNAGTLATLWVDDGLCPTNIAAAPFDAILAVNWTYHLDEFDLSSFFGTYSSLLSHRGSLVLDVIDRVYDLVPGNEYYPQDRDKPEHDRRRSDYRKRYTRGDIAECASRHGLVIDEVIVRPDEIPRAVYVLARMD